MPDLPTALKDAAYVTVGLGVLAFQRAQVQRVELAKQARSEANRLSGSVEERLRTVEDRLEGLQGQVEKVIDDLGERLPEPAAGALRTALTTAKEAQSQLRSLVAPGTGTGDPGQSAASPKS